MFQSKNPTALQSQKWIVESLLSLIETTEYNKISVSEICHTAKLDRRTFYRHFKSKNDVLTQYVIQLGEEYIEMFHITKIIDGYTATQIFFEFWGQHLCFIKNIHKCGLSDFVFKHFETFTKTHTELLVNNGIPKLHAKYVYAYKIGGFWNVMLEWAVNGSDLSPNEIALIVSKI